MGLYVVNPFMEGLLGPLIRLHVLLEAFADFFKLLLLLLESGVEVRDAADQIILAQFLAQKLIVL